jgi:hypothetical protein
MINLASLTALIRTLRQAGGPDGPAAPVARVPPVASLTPEDQPGGSGTAAVQGWARGQARNAALLDDELLRSAPNPRRAANESAVAGRGVVDVRGRPVGESARVPAPLVATITVEPESSALELTAGGKVLQSVLRASGGATPQPPAIVTTEPLVTTPRVPPPELARALHQALADSGLFYESHLARWVARDYPASALEREPQAKWPVVATVAGDDAVPTPVLATLTEASAQVLTRQLDALDTRALVWVGEVWPGQRASVAFEEEREAVQDGEAEGERAGPGSWRTRIALDLPSLGRVEATLSLRGEALDLRLEAPRGETRARLAEAREALATTLDGTRLALRQFAVERPVET